MAANKEATVIIIDIGPGMVLQKSDDDGPTPLENAKTCVEMIIQRKIFSESKDELALVVFGSQETDNSLADENRNEYKNISVLRGLKPVSWELLTDIQNIEATKTAADFVDALVVGMDILANQTKGKKFAGQRILLISNFCSPASDNGVEIIISGLKNSNMELNVVGPNNFNIDEDEEENSTKDPNDKPLSEHQLKSESLILNVLKHVEGESYSFEDALPALTYYQKKAVQSAPWNANLDIGPSLALQVTGYLKVSECKVKPWSTCYAQDENSKIIKEISYHLNDEGETQVEKEETVDAYLYGTSLVPFTQDDKANMNYENKEKGLKVLGFTKTENVKRHYYMAAKCHYFVGAKLNKEAQVALSAFIHALHETNMVAIVRYAYSVKSSPKIGFMAPRIRPSYECLVFIQLPFLEEIRHLSFPPLNANKKHIPTEEQQKAVDDLIDNMSLITEGDDEEKVEAFKIKDTCNPFLQRLYQCLQHRAFNSNEPLPPVQPHIEDKLKPPPELVKKSKPFLDSLKRLFTLKEVEEKKDVKTGNKIFQNGSKKDAEPAAKKMRLDDGGSTSLGATVIGSITEIGTINPANDFKYLINQGDLKTKEVCRQLEVVIKRLMEDPSLGLLQIKAVTCLKSYREEMIKKKDADQFNQFMKHLKAVRSNKNKPAWSEIIADKISLITKEECQLGGVPSNVAEAFLAEIDEEKKKDEEKPTEGMEDDDEEDAEDLLAEMGD